MKLFLTIIAATCLLSMPAIANACDMHKKMHHATPKLSKKLAKNPAVKAYITANKTMHHGMNIAYSGDADIDFVTGMIPHHQGAVDMANVLLKYGKDAELKALANRIIIAQEAEIGFMKQWLSPRQSNWKAENLDELESVKAYMASMETMHKTMAINYSGNADVDFARGMIPHHQGAIDMAWVLKKHGRDPQLRKLADDIIRSQAQEIALMNEWLAKQPQPTKSKK